MNQGSARKLLCILFALAMAVGAAAGHRHAGACGGQGQLER